MSGPIQRATSIVDGLRQSIGVAGAAPGQRALSELLCKRGHRWCTLFSGPRAQLSTCLMLILSKQLFFSIPPASASLSHMHRTAGSLWRLSQSTTPIAHLAFAQAAHALAQTSHPFQLSTLVSSFSCPFLQRSWAARQADAAARGGVASGAQSKSFRDMGDARHRASKARRTAHGGHGTRRARHGRGCSGKGVTATEGHAQL